MPFRFWQRTLSRSECWLFATPLLVLALAGGAFWVRERRPPALVPLTRQKLAGQRARIVRPPNSHFGQVLALKFSPDGQLLASCSGGHLIGTADTDVVVWGVKGLQLKPRLRLGGQAAGNKGIGGRGQIETLDFSPDGQILALGGDTRTYTSVLDKLPNGKTARMWQEAKKGLVELRRMPKGGLIRTLTTRLDVNAVAFSPDGKELASGEGSHGRGSVKTWDWRSGRQKQDWPRILSDFDNFPDSPKYKDRAEVRSVSYSPHGDIVASLGTFYGQSGGSCGVRLWDTRSGDLQKRFPDSSEPHQSRNNDTEVVAYSPDGKMLAINRLGSTLDHNGITLFDALSGAEIRRLAFSYGSVTSLAFSRDGRTIVGAGGNVDPFAFMDSGTSSNSIEGSVKVWEVATGRLKHQLDFPDVVTALAFAPNSTTLAVGIKVHHWGAIRLIDISSVLAK